MEKASDLNSADARTLMIELGTNRSAGHGRGSTIARIRRLIDARGMDVWVLTAFLVSVFLLGAFAILGSEVLEGETAAFDRWLLVSLRHPEDPATPLGPAWLIRAMVDFTALGGVAVLTLVTFLAVGFLTVGRKPALALFVLAAIGAGALVSWVLKSQFLRPRPELVEHLVQVNSASFPSGHAMNSAIVYLTLAALIARSMADLRLRTYLLFVSISIVVLIGFTRVYVGVHWPTDVLAGWTVGAAWAILCSLVAQRLQRRSAIEPESSVDVRRTG